MTTPPLNYGYLSFIARLLIGLLIVLSISSCASVGSAPSWTPCQHPEIDPSTQQGVERAVLSYQKEIDLCNGLNGQ